MSFDLIPTQSAIPLSASLYLSLSLCFSLFLFYLRTLGYKNDINNFSYTETLPLLYSWTHFNLRTMTSHYIVHNLHGNILPQRWAQIRYLSLEWTMRPRYDKKRSPCGVVSNRCVRYIEGTKEWPEACRILCTLPQLWELEIKIHDLEGSFTREKLMLLKDVKARVFEIALYGGGGLSEREKREMEKVAPFRFLETFKVLGVWRREVPQN